MKSIKLVTPLALLTITSPFALATNNAELFEIPSIIRSQPIEIRKNTNDDAIDYPSSLTPTSCRYYVFRTHVKMRQREKTQQYDIQLKLLEASCKLKTNPDLATSLCQEVIWDSTAGSKNRDNAKYILAQVLFNTNTKLDEAATLFQEAMVNPLLCPEDRANAKYHLADLKLQQDPQMTTGLCQELIHDKETHDDLRNRTTRLLAIAKTNVVQKNAEKLINNPTSRLLMSPEAKNQFALSYQENSESHFSIYVDVLAKTATTPVNRAMAKWQLARLYESVNDNNAYYLYRDLAHDQSTPLDIKMAAQKALVKMEIEDDSCIIS